MNPYDGMKSTKEIIVWLSATCRVLVLAICLVLLYLFMQQLFEQFYDISAQGWMTLFTAIFVVAGMYFANKYVNKSQSSLFKSIPVLFVLLLVIYFHFAPWNSRHAFIRTLYKVKIGMSVDEVEAVMAGYPGGIGWRFVSDLNEPIKLCYAGDRIEVSPSADGTINNHAVYSYCEKCVDSGIVRFKKSKVVDVSFSPD
ncbi:hypothetical protein ACFL6U_31315 [Planctomycetota bacterium]